MILLLVFVLLLIVFVIATASPRHGRKIQRATDKGTGWLKRLSERLWNPLTHWTHNSLELSRKSVHAARKTGKKLRRRLPSN